MEFIVYKTEPEENFTGGSPKPESIKMRIPRRREWSEVMSNLLLKHRIKSEDLSEAVNYACVNYAVVEYFAFDETEKEKVNDLSNQDVNRILDLISPAGTFLTKEQEKNLPSHSGQPNQALNADVALKSKSDSGDAKLAEVNLGS